MDRFIQHLPHRDDGDLRICDAHGIAYQADMQVTAEYDAAYLAKCASHPAHLVQSINEARRHFVARHVGHLASVVDVGVGDGAFVRARPHTWGLDINPAARQWLATFDRLAANVFDFCAVTMWDTLEHVPDPATDYLDDIRPGCHLFVSVPIFHSLDDIRTSRHYRPGEHLYYFTVDGLVRWLGWHGFRLLEASDFETEHGRDTIGSFAFRRSSWPMQSP